MQAVLCEMSSASGRQCRCEFRSFSLTSDSEAYSTSSRNDSQRKLGTPGPISIYENRLEIARLTKVVRQLETIIAERDAEQAAYRALLPPPPLQDLPYLPTSTPTFDEYHDGENYFNLANPEIPLLPYESTSTSLPPSNNYSHIPYDVTPYSQHQSHEVYTHPPPARPEWLLHSRASTWPSPLQSVNPYHLPEQALSSHHPSLPFDALQPPPAEQPITLPPIHPDHFSFEEGGPIGDSSQALAQESVAIEYDPHHPEPLSGSWSGGASFEGAQIIA